MTSGELARASGLTFRQLDYMVRTGRVHPQPDTGTRTGKWRRFTDAEAAVVITAGHLVHAGLTPRAALRAARQLADDGRARLGDYTLTPADGGTT